MSAGPRWITQAEVGVPEIVTLNNDDIISVSGGTPAIVIPATETLDYAGFPTNLKLIVKATVVLDTTAGAFTNVNNACQLLLAYGSDWSLTLGASVKIAIADGTLVFNPFSNLAEKTFYSFLFPEDKIRDGGLLDNAVAFVINNQGDGPFTDGAEGNSLKITIDYIDRTL